LRILLAALASACTPAEPLIALRWDAELAGEAAPPGLGPERRVILALTGTMGEISTHEQPTGLRIEGPFSTFPTAHAPVASGGSAFIVSTVGRVVGLAIGSGMQTASGPSAPLGVTSPLALRGDGVLVVGSTSGRLFAMQPDGATVYDVALSGPVDAAPAIAPDGTAYAAVFSPGRLAGVSPMGDIVFDQPLGESAGGVSVSGGLVAAGDSTGARAFLRSSGAMMLERPRQARVTGTILLEDGSLFASGEDGIAERIAADGTVEWTARVGSPIYANPVRANGEDFAVADSSGVLHWLDAESGETVATYELGGEPKPEIIVGETGLVYVAVGRKVIALAFVREP
jgi:hypothetical protein